MKTLTLMKTRASSLIAVGASLYFLCKLATKAILKGISAGGVVCPKIINNNAVYFAGGDIDKNHE